MSWMFLLFGGIGLLSNVEKPSSHSFIVCLVVFVLGLATAGLAHIIEPDED